MSESPPRSRRDARARVPAGLVGLLAILASLAGALLWVSILLGPWRLATGIADAKDHIDRAEDRLAKSDLKKGRYEALSATAAVERARSGLDSSGPLLDLARVARPVDSALKEVGHILSAADHSAKAAEGSVEVARRVLKGRHRVVAKDPDNPEDSVIRLDQVEELGAALENVHTEITATREDLEAVDLHNLPRRFRSRVTDGIEKASDTEDLLDDAEAGFKILPAFLGADGPRNYLFGMQNNAEQRGTGGAMLQMTVLSIADGRPELLKGKNDLSRVYDIDKNREALSIPLPDDAWYVAGVDDAKRFGNANWSPDWPLSANLTVAYGEESARQFGVDFPDVDGVIAVDPIVMKELLAGTGKFRVEDVGNRINERRVVDFLMYKAYATFPNPRQRHGALRKLVNDFYTRVVRPRHSAKLFSGMGTALAEKHMQIWMRDKEEEKFVQRMNWDAALEQAKGDDYINVVEQNVGGNKLDYYAQQTTTSDITIEGDDALHSTEMSVFSGLFLPQPRFAMGDTGRFSNAAIPGADNVHRPMLNLYVPLDSTLTGPGQVGGTEDGVVRLDGAPEGNIAAWSGTTPAEHIELGKKVWSGTLQIPPQKEGSLTFDYRVPGVVHDVKGRRVYQLHVQHQPKARPELLSLTLTLPDGATSIKAKGWKKEGNQLVWEKPLTEDMILEVSWQE